MEPSMNPTFQLPDWVAYSFAIVAFTVVANGILMHHIRVGDWPTPFLVDRGLAMLRAQKAEPINPAMQHITQKAAPLIL